MTMKDINLGKGILSVIASVFVTVVAGLVLFFIQTKEPSIVYSFEETLPFENKNERLTIYHITVENSGRDVASDIIATIGLNPAVIKEYRIDSDAPIEFKEQSDSVGLKIETVTLNPSEKFRVSILATSRSVFPDSPLIHIRGKGITGEKKEDKNELKLFFDADFGL